MYTYSKGDWTLKSLKYFWPPNFSTKFTKHGIKFEPIARQHYASTLPHTITECGLIVAFKNDWLAYSPDGIILSDGKPIALLEIKCPYDLDNTSTETILRKCKFLKLKNETIVLREKHSYYAQIQVGMAILNLKTCHFVIYSNKSNTNLVLHVPYNRQYTRNLLSKLKSIFYNKMLHVICQNKKNNS